ncbi:MAG: DUF349 domain-containing protein [Flavobacteriaceae bacterium]|nr:MAG: DUF349 domain-containing protein [Flavobacteriaceae bacterium]
MLEPKEEKEVLKSSVTKSKDEETVKVSIIHKKVTEAVEDDTSESVTDTTEQAIDEVENKIAETSEKEEPVEKKVHKMDYGSMDIDTLTLELEKLIKNFPVQQIKAQVESIKSTFNQKFGTLLAESKAAFLEAGGNIIDFQFTSPVKQKYNTLLSEYRIKKEASYKDLEKKLNENLAKRLQVIENLKLLIEEADTRTMYKHFRELQDMWRGIGPVSKTKYNDTWRTYQHHVERFYDLLHLSNDFRNLDFKKNLEKKLKLIKKAEDLTTIDDIGFAFKELQKLHKEWKEKIGPVAKEVREEVWQKFSNATKIIHDKRHEHYRELKSKYQEIITKKFQVIEAIRQYDISKNVNHKDWQKSIRDIEELRKQYFDAGKLPYSKSEKMWQQFKAATKKFNTAKNDFYKTEKANQQVNLKEKLALLEIAESLKDSEDWETATETFKKIQFDWRNIGHVPKRFVDDIWEKFKNACNHYFDRLHDQKNVLSDEQQAIVDTKVEFLNTCENIKKHTKDSVKEIMSSWSAIGRLPRSARYLESKFNKMIYAILEDLDIDKEEIVMLKFKNIVDGYIARNNFKKLDSERLFVRKKIDESEREIQQLENNLSFFSKNNTEENPLIENVKSRVEGYKKDLVIWKQKLDYLKKLNY